MRTTSKMTQNTFDGIPVFNTLFMVFPNMAHSTLPQMVLQTR